MRLKERIIRLSKSHRVLEHVRDSEWRRRRLLVLCYHGVSMHDEHDWSPALYVTQDLLRARLEMLAVDGYTVLPLTEALTRLYEGSLPPRSVAVTFDDGYIDFEQRALPVLREYRCPVTLYLTTYYAITRLPIFDPMVDYVLWRARHTEAPAPRIADIAAPIRVKTAEDRQRSRALLCDSARRRGLHARDCDVFIERVADALGVDYDAIKRNGTLQLMDAEQVRALRPISSTCSCTRIATGCRPILRSCEMNCATTHASSARSAASTWCWITSATRAGSTAPMRCHC